MSRDSQKMKSEQMKKEIIKTALEISLEEGFEGLSIRKISNRMNYSTGIIYYHFRDKQEIVEAIQEIEGKRLGGIIRDSVDPGRTFTENLREIYHNIMLLAFREAKVYNLVVMYRHSDRRPFNDTFLKVLCGQLEEAAEKGEVQVGDIGNTALAIWSSFLGFNLMISQRKDLSLEMAEQAFDAQMNLVLKGLLPGK